MTATKINVNRINRTIESHGRLNDLARICRRLGFRPMAQRGLSTRSQTHRGYFAIIDASGQEWHVIG